MKSLETLQKISKVGKILSNIVEICCMIGAIGCLIGIIALSILGTQGIMVNGMHIMAVIPEAAKLPLQDIYGGMIIGLVCCGFEVAIAKMAVKYFDAELAAGTPFTEEGAKQFRKLGIMQMVFTIVTAVIVGIVFAVFTNTMGPMSVDFDGGEGFLTGLTFIIISFIFQYGSDVKAELDKTHSAE